MQFMLCYLILRTVETPVPNMIAAATSTVNTPQSTSSVTSIALAQNMAVSLLASWDAHETNT